MAWQIKDEAGVLRTITGASIRDGTGIKRLLTARVMDADGVTLRTVATFVGPLSVAATIAQKTETVDAPVTVTASSLATPTGGLSPYTYVWTKLTGTFSVSSTGANATFTATLNAGQDANGTAKVVCTDAAGSTAESTITVALANVGSLGTGTE